MAKTEASIEIAAPLAEVWDLYFDESRWASWVDGFSAVARSDGYPEAGGTLVWRSTPAGRGDVSERVLEHRPRSLHRVAFEDPGAEGELEVELEMLPAGESEGRLTRVTQRLAYRVRTGGPLRPLTDLFFIRPQMRRSLERSLRELRLEAERIRGRHGP
jgi:uncharacterized protein YndB with AHSA1/START domain